MPTDKHQLRLGTCSWTAKGWETAFYSPDTKREDYIAEYARRYDTVEVDSTFYGVPRKSTLERWRDSTPNEFLFAAKAPKTITHDKFLDDCAPDLTHFLRAMETLGDKCGPLLFQFPYFAKRRGVEMQDFIDRLAPFLKLLPNPGPQFAVEVRNKTWLAPPLFDLLHAHNVALVLIDHPCMATPEQLFKRQGILTAPLLYIRWLGDRPGIEKITRTWNEVVVDRKKDLDAWAPHIKTVLDKGIQVNGYVNNHYSGHAPEDVDYIQDILSR